MKEKAMIKMGNEVITEATQEYADAIVKVLRAGSETHSEQQTIIVALEKLGELGIVHGQTITGSVFTDRSVTINQGEDSDATD